MRVAWAPPKKNHPPVLFLRVPSVAEEFADEAPDPVDKQEPEEGPEPSAVFGNRDSGRVN